MNINDQKNYKYYIKYNFTWLWKCLGKIHQYYYFGDEPDWFRTKATTLKNIHENPINPRISQIPYVVPLSFSTHPSLLAAVRAHQLTFNSAQMLLIRFVCFALNPRNLNLFLRRWSVKKKKKIQPTFCLRIHLPVTHCYMLYFPRLCAVGKILRIFSTNYEKNELYK